MSNEEKHAGTGKFCGECMAWIPQSNCEEGYECPARNDNDGVSKTWRGVIPGAKACKHFHPSVAVQQVEQSRRIADAMAERNAHVARQRSMSLTASPLASKFLKILGVSTIGQLVDTDPVAFLKMKRCGPLVVGELAQYVRAHSQEDCGVWGDQTWDDAIRRAYSQ